MADTIILNPEVEDVKTTEHKYEKGTKGFTSGVIIDRSIPL